MNSTIPFDDLNIFDKAAYYVTYSFYHPSNIIFKWVSPEYVAFVVMVGIAVSCVIIGSFSTLSKPKNAKDPITDTENPKWHPSDRDGSVYLRTMVSDIKELQLKLDLTTTLLFPILMSGGLYGLYYAINNYSREQILKFFTYYIRFCSFPGAYYTSNYILTVGGRNLKYWTGISFFDPERFRLTISQDEVKDTFPLGVLESKLKRSDFKTKDEYLEHKELRKHYHQHGVKFLKPVDVKLRNQKFNFVFDTVKINAIIYTIVFGIGLFKLDYSTNWLFLNSIAFNLTIYGLVQMSNSISNFKLAGLLLILLFFYDIYFVFQTDIMLSVATKLDVPMKFVIPRMPSYYKSENIEDLTILDILREIGCASIPETLLGLGDIVLPGSFIALCLRFDLYKYHESHPNTAFHHLQSFKKPYFIISLVGYILGLVTTIVVLVRFNHGQPALLYIVPSVLSSVAIGGFLRGELHELWNFSEEIPEFKKNDGTDSKDKETDKASTIDLLISGELIDEDEGDLTFDEDGEISEDEIDHEFEFFQEDEEEVEGKSALRELEPEEEEGEEEDDGHQTDLDAFATRVYSVDSDSDDDTFLIDSESDHSYNDIDISPNEIEVLRDEIEILRNDRKYEPRVLYGDYY
ncbi:hypothetical protein CLIB1423_03S02388 [[Candida] railenensis]|uniref:Uncharacterized protein n=1 Tax=[Candida] railenensis TaxID=45579 RepID=A0A9P0QM66_9ASCO|nr:hypothetical protein CLIB1423_03S02388 [[Candida] railenensis]